MLLILLLAASFYVFSLQLIWYYYHPVLLPIYYLVFSIVLVLAVWRYWESVAQSRLWIIAAASVLIGFIPYEMRLSVARDLLSPGDFDPETLSDVTRKWPMPMRATFELMALPSVHFLLQYAIARVVRRSPGVELMEGQ